METMLQLFNFIIEGIQKSPIPVLISIIAALISYLSYLNSAKALRSSEQRNIELNTLSSIEKKSQLLNQLQEAQSCIKCAEREFRSTKLNIENLIVFMGENVPEERKSQIDETMKSLRDHKNILGIIEEKIKAKYKAIEEMKTGNNPSIFELRAPEVTALKNEAMLRLTRAEKLQEDTRVYYDMFFKKYLESLK